jgi:ribosomal-protein-alanine N-acetyltransferase
MIIETPQLILREIRAEDAAELSAYRNHEEYGRYITTKPDPDYDVTGSITDKLERAAIIPKRYWPLVLVLKETDKVVGDLRVNTHEKFTSIVELAYGLNPQYWGNGYMSEAVKAVVDYFHDELKIHRIVIRADARNISSWKVAEKIGMQYEGSSRYEFMTWRGFMPELKIYASVRPELIQN